ncbi:carbohydrate porin [Pseudomonas sp. BP8]|uniref:carbohydrate porin n=1 Tax=Pseudomonas sp. BP8 TaxID=2817864 RepID=UPI001AE275FA|nr:carbohydrate porin [Pseudomonas sp. BP8]MBP2261549.1 porin [Pseudomonas sp. BP8]HDS1733458.1 carbohydrate porin [Pseudomonas putida]
MRTSLRTVVAMCCLSNVGLGYAQDVEDLKIEGAEQLINPTASEPQGCKRYMRYSPRTDSVARDADPCQTLFPSLGGLRDVLADHGMGFVGNINPSYAYDVLGHNAKEQLYNGQNPTYRLGFNFKLTYDLTRVGFGGDAQFIAGFTYSGGSYRSGTPSFDTTMQTFAINQRFFDKRLTLQYGYYTLIREYYGMVLGGNANSAARGPNSVIPATLGLTLFSPSPAFTVNIKDKSLRWYNQTSIARSGSPNRFQYDLDENPTGFDIKVKGSNPLIVDEFGYKRAAGDNGQRALWVRGGVIYNTSHYQDFKNGGYSDDNYGGYLAYTQQLSQPEGSGRRGLYVDAKLNYAPPDRNQYTGDVQMTAFYIGPFDSRPRDMAAVGLSRSFYSRYAREQRQARGQETEHMATGVSLSYAARLARGIYWVNALTYQQGPTFAPISDDALIYQSSFNFSF